MSKELATVNQNKSLGISGFIGYDISDLPIPYLRLIQSNTKQENKITNKGEDAKAGQLMHSLTGDVYESLDVLVLAAKKDLQTRKNLNTGEEYEQQVDKIIILPVGSKQPLILYASVVSSGTWRRYIGSLKSLGVESPYEIVTTVSSEDYTNKKGQSWKVFKFTSAGKATKEDVKNAETLLSGMNENVFSRSEDEEDKVEELTPTEEVVTAQEIPF